MILRRSKRTPVPKTIWEQKGAPSIASNLKVIKKNARTEQKTALNPIAIDTFPTSIKLDENDLLELPIYKPPLSL